MIREVECAGAPRDLGLAQGRSCAGAVRSGVPRVGWLARLRPPAARARLDRDLWRHHPQLAERLRGLALGAGVPATALLEALAADTGDAPVLALERPDAHDRASPGGALLARLLPGLGSAPAQEGSGAAGAGWILRRSRPDPGFASLELARPWLPGATAGVNEAGLAVTASGFLPNPEPEGREDSPVPGSLLVQGALQRFATATGAAEWLLRRPGGGRGAVVMADAAGHILGVGFAGSGRRMLAGNGVLVAGGPETSRTALAKASREATPGPESLAGALCSAMPGASVLILDPAARRILLLTGPEPSCLFHEISEDAGAA